MPAGHDFERQDIKPALPNSWRWVTLGEMCVINPSRPSGLQRNDNAPTTFVPMSAIDERLGMITRSEVRPFSEVRKGYTYFAEGDVLFAKTTPCMENGKHAIAQALLDGFGFGTTEFHVVRPGHEISPEWIHYFLRQPSILEAATAHFTGAVGQRRVPDDFLITLPIPLPPISDQKRLASILQEQMDAVERARTAAEAQLKAVKALPAAYLRAVFNSPKAQQWPRKRIGELARIQSGYAFKSEWFTIEGIRLLRNANVFQGYIAWNDEVRLPLGRRPDFKAYELSVGDIVLSLDRPVVSKGLKVARITPDDLPALLLQLVGRFQLSGAINSDYIYSFLNSPSFIAAITEHDQSIGVPHVSPAQVEAVALPLPPLAEQEHIARMLAEQMAQIDRLHQSMQAQLNAINKLPAAILRKAFTGRL